MPGIYACLVELYRKVVHILNQNEIVFWLNYGSLLGWHRSKSIIPWDEDVDLCILGDDYERALELLKPLGISPNFYNDPGCCALVPEGPDANFTSHHWQYGIDFVKYRIVDNVCVSNGTKTMDDFPCIYHYKESDVFPLREVVFCGDIAYVPNETQKILIEQYGDLNIPKDIDLSLYPMVYSTDDIRVCNFITGDIADRNLPFLTHHAAMNFPSKELLFDRFLEEKEIYGYGYENETDYVNETADILEYWHTHDTMPIKLLDCWCTDSSLTPSVIMDNRKYNQLDNKHALNYILTGKGLTKFHMDPGYGGG